jgi:ferredoxin-NADP reductase
MILNFSSKTFLGDNTWQFRFQPRQHLDWKAGQFIRIEVPHTRPDALGTVRRFTIAGIPADDAITITTRITGTTFKQALFNLRPGSDITLLDPASGDFLWQPSSNPHIYLAQGIGITPFYAILKDRRHNELPANARMYFSTKSDMTILFKSELLKWAQFDPSLHITFQTSPIDPVQIAQTIPALRNHLVYVSGPKLMLALCLPPINLPVANLKQDNFPGYAAGDY